MVWTRKVGPIGPVWEDRLGISALRRGMGRRGRSRFAQRQVTRRCPAVALEGLEQRLLLSATGEGLIDASTFMASGLVSTLDRAAISSDQGGTAPIFLGSGPSPAELLLYATNNANAADTTNTNQLFSGGGLGLNLTGQGVTVGVWDGGDVRVSHQEFGGRVTVIDSVGLNNHATHVTGTIAASGVSASAKGMASQVLVRSRDFDNDKSEMTADASLIDLSNHSYSVITGWTTGVDWEIGTVDTWFDDRSQFSVEDPDFGKYTTTTKSLDQILFDNPTLLSVWSSSNDNGDSFTNAHGDNKYVAHFSTPPVGTPVGSDPGWYLVENSGATSAPPPDGNAGTNFDLLPTDQVAKNTLVVGAVSDITIDPIQSSNVNIRGFSSRGPTDDGRIKPDVVANGHSLRSTRSNGNSSYGNLSGTSMSAPNATGTAALLVEHYRDLYFATPLSATTKGLIIHAALDAGNVGPDYTYGWGLIDAAAAATFLTESAQPVPTSLLQEATYTGSEFTFDVDASGAEPLKATIAWTDRPPTFLPFAGVDVSTNVLFRDLDLWIEGPGSTVHHPWTLDVNNPANPAVRTGANSVDNVEQVLIDTPTAGTYTIHVSGPGASQAFSLFVSGGVESGSIAPATLPYSENFDDGTADSLLATSGGWQVTGNRYEATALSGGNAVSMLLTAAPLPSSLEIDLVINAPPSGGGLFSNGLAVFDYIDDSNFKYVGVFAQAGKWRFGELSGGVFNEQLIIPDAALGPGLDIDVNLQLDGSVVMLSSGGSTVASHDFGENVTDGFVGLATRNAIAQFDDYSVQAMTGAALPYQEDFEDMSADDITEISGTWQITAGRYVTTPVLGENAIAVLQTADPLPSEIEIDVLANSPSVGGGFFKNALMIIDYQDAGDFKYVGLYAGAGKWRFGRFLNGTFTEQLIVVDAGLIPGADYNVHLGISGSMVMLERDGSFVASHDFGELITDGRVGLGTRNAVAAFDNFTVQEPAAPLLPYFEDFEDGIADELAAIQGTWQVTGGRYEATPTFGQNALSILQTTEPLPTNLQVDLLFNSPDIGGGFYKNALAVIDYKNANEFSYVGGFVGAGKWRFGHYLNGTFTNQLEVIDPQLSPGNDYKVTLFIEDSVITLERDGVFVASHDFGGSVTGGQVGVGTHNAVAQFDDFSVQELAFGELAGTAWNDLDGDGQFEPGQGEKGPAGWQVFLDEDGNLQLDTGERVQTTDANGDYRFTHVGPGVHSVVEVVQGGYQQSFPSVELADHLLVERVADGLFNPVYVTAAPGDADRLFIVEQHTARILILDLNTGLVNATPYLDISGNSFGFEQGLLGLAFDPDYADNGFFYVNLTVSDGTTHIRRYQVSPGDPDIADAGSATTVLTIGQPQSNHNGGWIGFGPDGMLYIGSGDGGGSDDNDSGHTGGIGNAQDTTDNLLGKMLRIDVGGDDFPGDPDRNYAIPSDNPFVGVTGDDEIWSFGLRNPWRASFDRVTGDLYIGDVGQKNREEIDFQPAASAGGENYEWRLREGDIATPTGGVGGPQPPGGVMPVYDYLHGAGPFDGNSVTGGYVYRGPHAPQLYGKYFFGDFISQRIWSIEHDGSSVTELLDWTTSLTPDAGTIDQIASFGEDDAGNLYVVDLGGEVFRVTQSGVPGGHLVDLGVDEIVEDLDFGNFPPAETLPYLENFDDGVPDGLMVTLGSFAPAAGRYEATPDVGEDSVSVLRLQDPLPTDVEISVLVNSPAGASGYFSNAVVVFDYQSPTVFKYAGVFFGAGKYRIGQVSGTNWQNLVIEPGGLAPDTDVTFDVIIEGSVVTVMSGGLTKATHDFGESLTDGEIGVATHSALAQFDNFSVQEHVSGSSSSTSLLIADVLAGYRAGPAFEARNDAPSDVLRWLEPGGRDGDEGVDVLNEAARRR